MIHFLVEQMPQFILLGLVGAAAWVGYKQMRKESVRVAERNRRAEAELHSGSQGTLVRDKDGVYRIEKD